MNQFSAQPRSLIRRTAIGLCLAVGLFFTAKAVTPNAQATSTANMPAAPEIAPVSTVPELVTQDIEDVRLGQRVVGTNPLREQTQPASDIDPETWRAVRLTMFEYGVQYDLAFLRPLTWIEATGAKVGGSIHMELHEMGLNGPAEVVAIDPCPEIEPDDGTGRNVVTGTMAHPGPNILYLDITGLDEPLGVTDTHPIWSETRQDFVVAGQLEVGEQFRTLNGERATLTKIQPHRGPPEMVFNLEVDGEHVYAVAESGLLVHNSCAPRSVANALSGTRLNQHLSQAQKYGKGGFRQLENGRYRYFGELSPASKPGEMVGRRVAREWDPLTGNTRTWMETLDANGRVRIVRPETGGPKVHYMFDEFGNFNGTF